MPKKKEISSMNNPMSEDELAENSVQLVKFARGLAVRQINIIQLMTYYSIGKWIVDVEQEGKERAKYGKQVIKNLSCRLNAEFEKGFSERNLENARKFYLCYKDRISQTLFAEFAIKKSQTVFAKLEKEETFFLPWSHYLQLIRIKDDDERNFYEIEAAKEKWSIRNLQRQYNSSYYERLALSRDKNAVAKMAKSGNAIEKPQDIIKQPTVLEFLGLKEESAYSESDLESAIIDKLQNFLLEMGKGYLFVSRQKRISFNEDNYYCDLVLYNRILKCFVVVDFKTDKLTHQDLGQMSMYVNYYDRYEKLPEENSTVGILICKEKNDPLVEITLPENANIFATEYKLCIPNKKLLQQKLKEWINETDK